CHSEQVTSSNKHPGDQECSSCYSGLPHTPTQMGAPCGSCHKAEQAKGRNGRATCADCQEPNIIVPASHSKSDNETGHRTPPDGHRDCTSCHQPHSGTPEKSCSNCHAEEAKSPHGQISSDCSDCHRPHGPDGTARAPSCGTCHQSTSLFGL